MDVLKNIFFCRLYCHFSCVENWKLSNVRIRHEGKKKINKIDKMPITDWGPTDDPSTYYLGGIQKIGITLGRAMEEIDPHWCCKIPKNVPKKTECNSIIQFM